MSVTVSISASNSTSSDYLTFTSSQSTIEDNNSTNSSQSSIIILADSTYYFIGSLMAIVFSLGVTENAMILIIYAINRKLRTVNNVFVIGLALSDIGQALCNIPLFMVSSFSKTWIFGDGGCVYYAFITTTFGIAQIALLTVIALERYFIIVHHNRRLSASMSKAVCTIISCFIFATLWAIGPLFGWSKYEMEKAGIACCVSWDVRKPINLSYTMSLFTFGWFIPLSLISYGYLSIAFEIYKERAKKHTLGKPSLSRKTSRERKVAITVLLMIGVFVFSWMPYSIVSLCSALIDMEQYSHMIILAPAIFAKSSIIWNPIIYVARHNDFRRAGLQTLDKCAIPCFRSLSQTHVTRESINRTRSDCVNTAKRSNLSVSFEPKPQYRVYKSSNASTDTSTENVHLAKGSTQAEISKSTDIFCKDSGKRYRLITSTDIEDSLIEITDHESSDAFETPKDLNVNDLVKDISRGQTQIQPSIHMIQGKNTQTQTDMYDKYLRRRRYTFTKAKSETVRSLGSYQLKSQLSADKEKCLATLKIQREGIRKLLNEILCSDKKTFSASSKTEIKNVDSSTQRDLNVHQSSENTANIVDIYSQSRLRRYDHDYVSSTRFPFPQPSTSSAERRALSDSAYKEKNRICHKGVVRPKLQRQESHISQRCSIKRKQPRTAISKRERYHQRIPVEMKSYTTIGTTNESSQTHDSDTCNRIVIRQSTV